MRGCEESGQVSLRSREKASRPRHEPAQAQERGPWQQEVMAGEERWPVTGRTGAEPWVKGQTAGNDWWLGVCRGKRRKKREETPLPQSHRLVLGPRAGDKGETITAEDGNPETEERAGPLQSCTRASAGLVGIYRFLT